MAAAEVIALPGAASKPVFNKRRAGSYGKKVVSFRSAASARDKRLKEQRLESTAAANKDTVEALECLLGASRHLRGTVIYFLDDDGHEDAIFTGLYRAKPAEALKATLQITAFLERKQHGQ